MVCNNRNVNKQVSVAAGAVLAGATPQEVEACEKYALAIGLAFQGKDKSISGIPMGCKWCCFMTWCLAAVLGSGG